MGPHLVSTEVSFFLHCKINLDKLIYLVLNSKLFLRAGAIRPFLIPSCLQALSVFQRYLTTNITFVYLALHGNEVLSVSTKSVNLDLEGRQNILCHICLCLAVWLCLKMGSGNMVLVRLLGKHFATYTHFCIPFWISW